jgi:shikimate kinase
LQRLKAGKEKRPLIAHLDDEQLEEFIRKHLFERQYYYNQAQCIVDLNDLSVASAVERVKSACFYSK